MFVWLSRLCAHWSPSLSFSCYIFTLLRSFFLVPNARTQKSFVKRNEFEVPMFGFKGNGAVNSTHRITLHRKENPVHWNVQEKEKKVFRINDSVIDVVCVCVIEIECVRVLRNRRNFIELHTHKHFNDHLTFFLYFSTFTRAENWFWFTNICWLFECL